MKAELVVSAVLFSTALFGYSQQVDRFGRPSWLFTAKPQAAAAQAAEVNSGVQAVRASYFNLPARSAAVLPDQSGPPNNQPQLFTGGTEDTTTPEQFPTSTSDAVVKATVTSQMPHLTQDHRQVYSELTFTPVSIVKDATRTLVSEHPATILALGGALQLPSGRTVSSVPHGGTNPVNLNIPYLLFLRYIPDAKAFIVSKVWSLSGSKPQELDGDGQAWNRVTSDSQKVLSPDALLTFVQSRVNGNDAIGR